MSNRYNKQSGLVSILTVLMFTIFISVFVVGFIKIMTDEQRQTTDNDLSASALAAAQSGVEDAKRIILYCEGNSGNPCKNLLNSANDCEVFLKNDSNSIFTSENGINFDGPPKTKVIVGNPDFQQSYTCLTIDSKPTDIKKSLASGKSEIIPLDMDGLTQIGIKWSVDQGNYGLRNASSGSDFASAGSWTGSTAGSVRPPVLRVQIIPYRPGSVDLSSSESGSDAFFLVPASSVISSSVARTSDGRGTPGNVRSGGVPVVYTGCTTSASLGYSCSMDITGFNASPTEHYYLRLSLFYGGETEVTITGQNGATPVTFDGTQYVVDVTGQANDVYRRVQARVSPSVYAAFPEFAVETGGPICKNIRVGNTATTNYACNP